jgi:GntR family transcriptional regulator/MocR family aminotransferase
MLLELDGRGPRYAQITRALQGAIRDGTVLPGERLPSHRQLAAELQCARNLVVLAYEQLILEGYLVARAKAGTFVSPDLPRVANAHLGSKPAKTLVDPSTIPRPIVRRLRAIASVARETTARMGRHPVDFAYGMSEPDSRIIRRLRTSFSAALRRRVLGYGDPAGDFHLREQIAARLRGTRGIVCAPSQIVITSGTQQALDICARLLLSGGGRVAVEDPGYNAARAAFEWAGATIVPVAVDHDGLNPAYLPNGTDVRAVYVTPSHQFPTGSILSAPRRHALLAWARRKRTYIVEDDYDGELRYQGQPLTALAGLEPAASVIYCGTFSKSLFPALRLGYLVLPSSFVEPAIDVKWMLDRGSSILLQRVLRDLMISGEYDRHLRRMRRRYAQRREVLTRALSRCLGPHVEIGGAASGLHIVAWLPHVPVTHIDELIAGCRARGVGVYSVAGHAIRRLQRAGLMLGYGFIKENAIERGVRELADVYYSVTGDLPATTVLSQPHTAPRGGRLALQTTR